MSRGLDSYTDQYVYRCLRPNQRSDGDIVAMQPYANISIEKHIDNGLQDPTQFISTVATEYDAIRWGLKADSKTRSIYGNTRDTIVKIDVNYMKTNYKSLVDRAYDFTRDDVRRKYLSTAKTLKFARAWKEVVFEGCIPKEAVSGVKKKGGAWILLFTQPSVQALSIADQTKCYDSIARATLPTPPVKYCTISQPVKAKIQSRPIQYPNNFSHAYLLTQPAKQWTDNSVKKSGIILAERNMNQTQLNSHKINSNLIKFEDKILSNTSRKAYTKIQPYISADSKSIHSLIKNLNCINMTNNVKNLNSGISLADRNTNQIQPNSHKIYSNLNKFEERIHYNDTSERENILIQSDNSLDSETEPINSLIKDLDNINMSNNDLNSTTNGINFDPFSYSIYFDGFV